ncbi:MAG: sodium ion-translocating decarboxylase subunit beta [Oscillospiraceae bacterium]|nr:sodium ion-translocating decarboxylase subunit beta [Oscillospiraceae bacterium]
MKKFLAVLLAVLLLLSVTACTFKEDASVGIIGGADGPTAIFVTR